MRIKIKSEQEIKERLKDLIHRHQKRYIKNCLKPSGLNCKHRAYDENKDEYYCAGCGTRDPEVCLKPSCFEAEQTTEELRQSFHDDLCNTERMLRDYRDIATLMWVLGQFDDREEYERQPKTLLEPRIVPNTLKSDE